MSRNTTASIESPRTAFLNFNAPYMHVRYGLDPVYLLIRVYSPSIPAILSNIDCLRVSSVCHNGFEMSEFLIFLEHWNPTARGPTAKGSPLISTGCMHRLRLLLRGFENTRLIDEVYLKNIEDSVVSICLLVVRIDNFPLRQILLVDHALWFLGWRW